MLRRASAARKTALASILASTDSSGMVKRLDWAKARDDHALARGLGRSTAGETSRKEEADYAAWRAEQDAQAQAEERARAARAELHAEQRKAKAIAIHHAKAELGRLSPSKVNRAERLARFKADREAEAKPKRWRKRCK